MSFFGPNDVGPHHRGPTFSAMLRDTLTLLRGLASDFLPVVVSGSGTTALDLVHDALPAQFVHSDHLPFASRISAALAAKEKLCPHGISWRVQYDPGVCQPDLTPCSFVDAVSSFPYYDPTAIDGFVTVSSKQLGAAPVLGVVYLKPHVASALPRTSRLAALYAHAYEGNAMKASPFTPNTPAVPLIESLLRSLERFDVGALRRRCDERRTALGSLVEGVGPVCRTRIALPTHLEPYRRDEFTRLFLWSGSDAEFDVALSYIKDNT